jgi:hypothetical protein
MVGGEYNFEKAAHYTEQVVGLAQDLWGERPLSPRTFTWSDGTVSIQVKHTFSGGPLIGAYWRLGLNFQETGFSGESEMAVRETVEYDWLDGNRVVYDQRHDTEVIEPYD